MHIIFRNYLKGEVFSVRNALHYRTISWIFFWDALLIKSLSHTLLVFAVTFSNPPGHRYFSVSFGSPNFKILVIAWIFLMISQVMMEGSRLQEKQDRAA